MSLRLAIAQLEAEIAGFKQGTAQQPKEGSVEWFLLRAKATGLSMLKRMEQLDVERDAAAAERYYRKCGVEVKAAEVPPAEVVLAEVQVP